MNHSKTSLHRRLALFLMTLLIVTEGCKSPADSNGTKQQAKSRLQKTTLGDVTLVPSRPVAGLELLIPEDFGKMSESMIATKYPAANRPTLVYTNQTGAINIAINHTQNRISPNQLDQLHVQLDSSIRQSQPNAKWMYSGFQIYDGRRWTQLEFQSNAIDTTVHNMMIATSADGRMLAISFNCTDEYAAKWLDIGREVIKSATYSE